MTLKLTNKIAANKLRPGDRIYAYRKATMYSHHGIFVGGNRVIHFHRTEVGNASGGGKRCKICHLVKDDFRRVVKSCIKCFLDGHSLRRFRYGVSDSFYLISRLATCTTESAPCPVETVNRANDLFDKKDFGNYDMINNNCETFAVYCTTGSRWSDQADTAISLFKVALDRLYRDVKRNHGKKKLSVFMEAMGKLFHDLSNSRDEENLKVLNQMIGCWDANRSSPEEIIEGMDRRLRRSVTA